LPGASFGLYCKEGTIFCANFFPLFYKALQLAGIKNLSLRQAFDVRKICVKIVSKNFKKPKRKITYADKFCNFSIISCSTLFKGRGLLISSLNQYRSPVNKRFENKILYHDKILMAEKLLEENLQGIFPGVDTIAKKVTLSESTLKRYFKTIFRRSLYEHYLELKMEHAKKLLFERRATVNEVASILNYENVSSFIETFKKHHGYSPGQLKREIRTAVSLSK